jgi:hypothetical protein
MAIAYPTTQELHGLPVEAAQKQMAAAFCEKNKIATGSVWNGKMHSKMVAKMVAILFSVEMSDPRIARLEALGAHGALCNDSQFGKKHSLRPEGGKLSSLEA